MDELYGKRIIKKLADTFVPCMGEDILIQAKACMAVGDYKYAKKFFDLYLDTQYITEDDEDFSPLYSVIADYMVVIEKLYHLEVSESNPIFLILDDIFKLIKEKKIKRKGLLSDPLSKEELQVSKLKIYELDSILHFGKYKGNSLSEMISNHPSYIFWCMCNVNFFAIENTYLLFPKLRKRIFLNKKAIEVNIIKIMAFNEHMARSENYDESDQFDDESQWK